MLNSIGLDNDGLDVFLAKHVPYLTNLGAPLIANVAGRNVEEYVEMASRLNDVAGIAAIELNISCPNVSGGVDFGTHPGMTAEVVASVREACTLPIIAKLTPNVANIVEIAGSRRGSGGRRCLVCQHAARDGDRLASTAACSRERRGWVERAGHQAGRPEVCVAGCPTAEDSRCGCRWHLLGGRRDGVSRRGGVSRSNRHGQLLQSHVSRTAHRATARSTGGDRQQCSPRHHRLAVCRPWRRPADTDH